MKTPTSWSLASAAVLAVLFSGAGPAAAAPDDPLWARAVAVARANRAWVPGLTVSRSENLRGNGTVESSEEVWLEHREGSGRPEIVRIVRDGRDVTAQALREREVPDPSDDELASLGPFDAAAQRHVMARPTGEERTIAGRRCRGYAFTDGREEASSTGTAWLDAETGAPLELQVRHDPPPPDVKSLTTTLRFEHRSPEEWYPVTMESEGSGGSLFKSFRFRMSATFSKHWKRGDAAAAASRAPSN